MSSVDFSDHSFISTYLKYIENTETPRLHHLWAGLSGVSAAMGRRCWYDQDVGQLFPNLFVVLVGPSAVRKSTALKMMQALLRDVTNVKFAPDDTGGQRQGILRAMVGNQDGDETENAIASALEAVGEESLAGLAQSVAAEKLGGIELDLRDRRTIYVCQSELKAFLGENNTQMTTFMCKMYDGDSYEYQLKSSSYTLRDALLGLLGCTTPSEIALSLPHEAIGGGFTSRVIFVYADRIHRKIPRPTVDKPSADVISNIFEFVHNHCNGAFKESPEAAKLVDEFYIRGVEIKDPRFVNYLGRRDVHLKKLAMTLAASRKSMTIEAVDVHAADQLLLITEETMPDALGEYGMSPLSAAKQKMMDYIKSSTGPIPEQALAGIMAKDMRPIDFRNCMSELINTGKISVKVFAELGSCLIATSSDGAAKKLIAVDPSGWL